MKKVKLGDYITQLRGVTYSSGDSIKQPLEGYIPILRSNNIEEGIINFEDLIYVPQNLINDYQYLKKGDILITASTGSLSAIGKNGQIENNFKGSFGAFCKVVRALPSLETKYLKFYFQTPIYRNTIKNVINGANINNINNNHINDLEIPLPPLETQKKIAAILDAADEYRQKTKALIEKCDQLAESLFLEMFGDPFSNKYGFPKKKLGSLCQELFLGLTNKVDYVEYGGYPLIRATDINKGELSFENVKFISEVQHKKLTKYRITKKGDVLVSKSGSLGVCALVNTDKEFSTYESIFTIRTNLKLLNNVFFIYLLRNKVFQDMLLGNKVGGTVSHLNLNMIKEFTFPIPPISLQNQFADRIQLIEHQKKQAQSSLLKAEELFNSLLQRAFKGELV